MKIALPCIAASLLLGLSSQALAGGYVGAGIGSEASISGDLSGHFDTDEASSGRIVIGHRMGALALEASLFGSDLVGISDFTGRDTEFSTLSLGVDLKYHLGLVGGLELYGKIGLNKTWLRAPDARDDLDYSGRGHALGAGLQYTFPLPVTEISLWLDYTRQTTELRDSTRRPLDGDLGMLGFGVSVGF